MNKIFNSKKDVELICIGKADEARYISDSRLIDIWADKLSLCTFRGDGEIKYIDRLFCVWGG